MNTQTNGSTRRAWVMAARGALVALALAAGTGAAVAQDTGKPTGTVEVGTGPVSQGSYKAGEYNGLEKQGAFPIGNLDLRNGMSFNSASAFRWRIKGIDLGLATRNIFAQIGVQGLYRVRFSYDGLLRNRSDSYQTPYNGVGNNVLTLPATWLVPSVAGSGGTNPTSARGLVTSIGDAPFISTAAATNGAVVTPTAAQTALVNAAASADVPLFRSVNLSTTRNRYEAGVNYIIDSRWTLDATFRPEHKNGLKPMGTVSRNIPAGATAPADISTVIPDRIDTNTDQTNVSLAFKAARGFAQAGYYRSSFTNSVPFMSWQNWATAAGTTNTISSAPGNTFNQIQATTGYNFSSATKLVANGSYGRNTQNDSFITNPTTPIVPVSSLNGLVVSTAFNAKFTTRLAKKLNLIAAYKYDNRDNRTAVHIYQYADAEEAPVVNASFPAGPTNPLGAVVAQNANANRPYSKRLSQLNFDADYAVAKGQWLKAGYDYEAIDRRCPGSWISCADAAATNERTLRAEWRATVGGDFSVRLGYAYAQRRAPDYNENAFLALVPYAGVIPAGQTMSALQAMNLYQLTGYGPTLGFNGGVFIDNVFFPNNNVVPNALYANNNRISELIGMRRYYVADRNRDKVRTLFTWQASERLSLQARWDSNKDDYPTSVYGLQRGKGWTVNLDGTYALADDLSVNVFYTSDTRLSVSAGNTYTANSNTATITNGQPGIVGLSGNSCDSFTTLQQRNNNNKLDPCLNWFSDRSDRARTAGVGVSKKAAQLEVTGNVIATRARWDNTLIGGNWANNILDGPGAAPTITAAFFIPATALQTITTNTVELRLNGQYTLGHGQTVRVAYAYLRMRSADSAYDGMQFGSLATQVPTNEQPFNYNVHVVGVSYILKF